MQTAPPDFDLSNWQISDARFDLIEIKIEIRIESKAEQAEQTEQAAVHAGALQLQTLTRRASGSMWKSLQWITPIWEVSRCYKAGSHILQLTRATTLQITVGFKFTTIRPCLANKPSRTVKSKETLSIARKGRAKIQSITNGGLLCSRIFYSIIYGNGGILLSCAFMLDRIYPILYGWRQCVLLGMHDKIEFIEFLINSLIISFLDLGILEKGITTTNHVVYHSNCG